MFFFLPLRSSKRIETKAEEVVFVVTPREKERKIGRPNDAGSCATFLFISLYVASGRCLSLIGVLFSSGRRPAYIKRTIRDCPYSAMVFRCLFFYYILCLLVIYFCICLRYRFVLDFHLSYVFIGFHLGMRDFFFFVLLYTCI